VQVLDADGKPVSGVTSEPDVVTIRPVTAPAPADRGLLVVATWKGQPAFGFRVKDYEILPKQVQLKGSPDVVSRYSTIETEPIDLTGIKNTTIVNAHLKRLPQKAGTVLSDSVKVRIVIEAAPTEEIPSVPPSAGTTGG
jgi:YbbR domain-containing protein